VQNTIFANPLSASFAIIIPATKTKIETLFLLSFGLFLKKFLQSKKLSLVFIQSLTKLLMSKTVNLKKMHEKNPKQRELEAFHI